MSILYLTLTFVIFLFSISLHEYAHGLVAWRLGDPTARNCQRLTLNPLAHIDTFKSLLLPLLLVLASNGLIPPLGQAKPIPINPYHLRNPKHDLIFIGAAGPITNIILVVFFTLLSKTAGPWLKGLFALAALINLVLACINLIPIPPLDGSRILSGILPFKANQAYRKLERFSVLMFIPLAIIIARFGIFNKILNSLHRLIYSL